MTDRRSGEDRRTDWIDWMAPQIERAIEAGMTEDHFMCAILSAKRPQVRRLFREIAERKESERCALT